MHHKELRVGAVAQTRGCPDKSDWESPKRAGGGKANSGTRNRSGAHHHGDGDRPSRRAVVRASPRGVAGRTVVDGAKLRPFVGNAPRDVHRVSGADAGTVARNLALPLTRACRICSAYSIDGAW